MAIIITFGNFCYEERISFFRTNYNMFINLRININLEEIILYNTFISNIFSRFLFQSNKFDKIRYYCTSDGDY